MAAFISVVIPTYYPDDNFHELLKKLISCPKLKAPIIVDSTPHNPQTREWQAMGATVHSIDASSFSHGKTREMMRRISVTPYTLFITQDISFTGFEWLEMLAQPVLSGTAAVAYARQLPHDDADFFAKFDRQFNYPQTSRIQQADSRDSKGRIYFCSNSCALWNNQLLDKVGGFPEVSHNEDMLAAAKLINAGLTVAYVAEAEVKHSHNMSPTQLLKRYYAIGKEITRNHSLLNRGNNSNLGANYSTAIIAHSLKHKPCLLPKTIMVLCAKALGYYAGKTSAKLTLLANRLIKQ